MPDGSAQSSTQRANSREVIDPVSHLPIHIHDATFDELDNIQALNLSDKDVDPIEFRNAMLRVVRQEKSDHRWANDGQERRRLTNVLRAAAASSVGTLASLTLLWKQLGLDSSVSSILCTLAACSGGSLIAAGTVLALTAQQHENSASSSDTERKGTDSSDVEQEAKDPETAMWLNFLLHSIWPIVNPALFISVSDMLEDVLQASLPTMIKGVRVADIGQGAEPLRIIGIRGLHAGEAASEKGGMKGEEGEFINLEVSVAYRAREGPKTLKGRSQNMHLLMQFRTTGNILLPVWVEITGIIATARLRIQLTPNPPFLAMATVTLLGQPKVTVKCTPLSRQFLNIMDIPVLSNWLQSSIDSAISAYVAPRSLELDLKTMLSGKEKLDTDALGCVFVKIHSAKGLRAGDEEKLWKSAAEKQGDLYVTLSWAKWGKPLWSSRIIQKDGEPVWEEHAMLLLLPADVNAQERLKVEIWDADRLTADDHIGGLEVSLADIMSQSKLQITEKESPVTDADGDEAPGTIKWSYGFFPKTTLSQHFADQREADKVEGEIKDEATKKLREAPGDENGEIEQQKEEDFQERSQEILAGMGASSRWPTGVLHVRVQQITGLEVPKVRQSGTTSSNDDEESDDLPSAYCVIMINHQRVFKTRTKMKASNPYYDAGTEKVIRDWRNAMVFIAVRDSRVHEKDPLLGMVVLPLRDLLKNRSQILDSFPLVGGIGYGRMKVSLIFRSLQLKLPKELLGWDEGTLEIAPELQPVGELSQDLLACRLLVRTIWGKGRIIPRDQKWQQRRDKPIFLPVRKRYASCLLVQFKKYSIGPDMTPAFCTLWLKDVPDEEEVEFDVPVRKASGKAFDRGRLNATQDIGEHIGTIRLKARFWPGLSGYHQNLTDSDGSLADVMEVLDAAEISNEVKAETRPVDDGEASDSSSDSSDDEKDSDSPLKGIKEYKAKQEKLNRRHRGIMQWGAVRKLAWVGQGAERKAGQAKEKLKSGLTHQGTNIGMDTEV